MRHGPHLSLPAKPPSSGRTRLACPGWHLGPMAGTSPNSLLITITWRAQCGAPSTTVEVPDCQGCTEAQTGTFPTASQCCCSSCYSSLLWHHLLPPALSWQEVCPTSGIFQGLPPNLKGPGQPSLKGRDAVRTVTAVSHSLGALMLNPAWVVPASTASHLSQKKDQLNAMDSGPCWCPSFLPSHPSPGVSLPLTYTHCYL